MTERIARDSELETRNSILRITYLDATVSERLSAVDDTGIVKLRPYERTVLLTTATASGHIYVYLPDAGLVAGQIFSVFLLSGSNSKYVKVRDASGQVSVSDDLTATSDHILAFSNGLFWTLFHDTTT